MLRRCTMLIPLVAGMFDGEVKIMPSSNSGMCLDLPGGDASNGNLLWMWQCNGQQSQNWFFDGDAIKFAGNSNMCIDVVSGWLQSGTQIELWECNGYPQQAFGYDWDMQTLYLSQSGDASMCLDLPGGEAYNGLNTWIWECNGTPNQQWIVDGSSPSPGPGPAPVGDRCASQSIPSDSRCSGCPPMKDGKLCASTTRYNDQTKGACGCGDSDPVPQDWWTKVQYTAALNCVNLDSENPHLSWCPSQCGGCYRLCSTGGTTVGQSTDPDVCRVFKIDNRCGDGYDGDYYSYWCSQKMSWWDCQNDPLSCAQYDNTNSYGYSAHFDLQDLNGQILGGLNWDNVEVTFEKVSCSEWEGPSWDCQCNSGGDQFHVFPNVTLV